MDGSRNILYAGVVALGLFIAIMLNLEGGKPPPAEFGAPEPPPTRAQLEKREVAAEAPSKAEAPGPEAAQPPTEASATASEGSNTAAKAPPPRHATVGAEGGPAGSPAAEVAPGLPKVRQARPDVSAEGAGRDEEVSEPMIWEASREGIVSAIQERIGEIKECYDGWVRIEPSLTGRLETEFVISTDPEDPARGKVTEVGVTDADFEHAFMEGCVLHVFEDLRFEPPAKGAVTVRHQMRFSKAPPKEGVEEGVE